MRSWCSLLIRAARSTVLVTFIWAAPLRTWVMSSLMWFHAATASWARPAVRTRTNTWRKSSSNWWWRLLRLVPNLTPARAACCLRLESSRLRISTPSVRSMIPWQTTSSTALRPLTTST